MAVRHDPFPVQRPYHGIYAHGVEASAEGRILHVSGQTGMREDGYLADDFKTQCRQSIRNIEAVLHSARMSLTDLVKMSCFLVRREDMDELVAVRQELLDGIRPAITTVYVAGLVSPDWLIEIEAIACAGPEPQEAP
ncbi:MAG: RidA family protein [Pseudomonadota bacterium]